MGGKLATIQNRKQYTMKWIKASERLPKKSGTVIFRKIMFPEPIGQEFDTRLGFRLFRGYLFNDYNIIEWLDESAESDSGEQVRKLREGLGEMISTIERNAVDNRATIENVKLWAKSWREELLTETEG